MKLMAIKTSMICNRISKLRTVWDHGFPVKTSEVVGIHFH